jgi:cell surface protein SprA
VGYNFVPQQKFVEPLKNVIKSSSPWLALVRDFNFNYRPSVSLKADVFRQFGAIRNRNVNDIKFQLPETYDSTSILTGIIMSVGT